MNGAMLRSIICIQCQKKYYLIFNVPLYYLYQLHCPGNREFCFAVLVWMWNVFTCLRICSFQVALFGKGMELLGNGILLEKAGHCAWTSRLYSSATLSILPIQMVDAVTSHLCIPASIVSLPVGRFSFLDGLGLSGWVSSYQLLCKSILLPQKKIARH